MPRSFGAYGTPDGLDSIQAACPLPSLQPKRKQPRQRFTDSQDELIVAEVGGQRFPNWNEIAAKIPGKTARQVRERYQHYLNPAISQEPFSREEDDLICQLYNEYGPNWAKMAEVFQGRRTNNSIKNRWNNHLRGNASTPSTAVASPRPLPLPLTVPVFGAVPEPIDQSDDFLEQTDCGNQESDWGNYFEPGFDDYGCGNFPDDDLVDLGW